MRLQCDQVENQVESTKESTKAVLEGAASLREERCVVAQGSVSFRSLICYRQDVETRKSIVTLFISRFTLTEEEEEAIISRDVPIGPKFFAAMDKTERIREECRVLMAGEEGPTQAG
jgi:conserved oligomeric Golgi complex subunit 6